MIHTVTIVGTGLIGGSFALALKNNNIATHIIGVDNNTQNLQKALEIGLVDEILNLEKAIKKSHFIYVAIPVDEAIPILKKILQLINTTQIVADAGSTKLAICEALKNETHRSNFVATHPMWGTEHSGPQAAVHNAFVGKACVICEKEKSQNSAVVLLESIYKKIGMHLVYMPAEAHDLHAAYISHLPHFISFALANTVLQKEKKETTIFEMASGGFESTVRLAKSNPAMWVPIFKQNKNNLITILDEYTHQIAQFKIALQTENYISMQSLIEAANTIKRIIK